MTTYDETIPRRIIRRREELDLAAYELALKAGISPSYLSLIESAQKIPSAKVAQDLARALGEDPDLFLAWVETEGGEDLDSRGERIDLMRAARSQQARGMREWQRNLLSRVTRIGMSAREMKARMSRVVPVPLLEEGTDPHDAAGTGDTISIDASLLDDDQDRERLFAYRVSSKSAANVIDVVSPGDTLIFAADPEGVDPSAVYAVRVRGGIVLSRLAYTRPTLFLMPGQPGEPPVPLPVRDERALRGLLAGVAVASIRTWSKPNTALADAGEPSLGRAGQLDDDGNIVRDCEWREPYGWRPVQRSDDLEYLLAQPGKKIRFRLLRDGRLRYVLEMDAAQWQEALGDYYGGPGWYRNGYIVAITKRKQGEYTEEFQERWAGYVTEPGETPE